ncbi:MAG: flagellar biosynthesis protein FlhB [Nitrospirae bacterium]|nr:flagellar biosynthesis protein FlhB [Nitrospirota bacterium]
MADDDQERSEQATPKRQEDARKKGQVARSQEVTSAVLILGAVGGFAVMGPSVMAKTRDLMATMLTLRAPVAMTEADVYVVMMAGMSAILTVTAPVMAWFAVLGIGSLLIQPGFVWTATPLVPNWSHVSPLAGLKRLFSVQSAVVSLKTLFKFGVITAVAYVVVGRELPSLVTGMTVEPSSALSLAGGALFRLGLWSGGVIAVLGAGDYAYQRWEHERKLRMSRQDLKDEFKETEGNPLLRTRIRSLQRERSRKRMMADVPKADVVITNPTSLAVALMYRQGQMAAPQVVAKGAGFVAQRIRELARKHGVPVMEHKPLARALFKTTEVGAVIPSKFYRAVAEVLAYVYRIRRTTAQSPAPPSSTADAPRPR